MAAGHSVEGVDPARWDKTVDRVMVRVADAFGTGRAATHRPGLRHRSAVGHGAEELLVAGRACRTRSPGRHAAAAAHGELGRRAAFRTGLRARGVGYVLAVACDQHVTTGAGRGRVDLLTAGLPRQAWQPRSAGDGSKGPRDYDWAWIAINPETPWHNDDRWVLLALTTNEIRHLLNVLIIKPAQRLIRYLGWSTWRRAHQARARRLHYRRRTAA